MKKALFLLQIVLSVMACLLFSCCAAAPASIVERGSAWLSGSGIPTADAGEAGDYYLDFQTGSVYEKTAEGWTVRGNLTPATEGKGGSAWLSGSGIPTADAGEAGDYYLDFETGSVYEKTAEGWTVRGNLKQTAEKTETITITFDANGGELPKGYLRENTLKKGDSFALPVPTREGYTFLGWFYGEGANGGQASDLTVFARDVLLTAKWHKLHVLTLIGEETNQLGAGAFHFSGEYDGTDAATFTLYLEKDGVRKRADMQSNWLVQDPVFQFTQSNHTFRGHCAFAEEGDYRLILVVEEGDETVEASIAFSVTE